MLASARTGRLTAQNGIVNRELGHHFAAKLIEAVQALPFRERKRQRSYRHSLGPEFEYQSCGLAMGWRRRKGGVS